MLPSLIFDRFVKWAPISVMVRAVKHVDRWSTTRDEMK